MPQLHFSMPFAGDIDVIKLFIDGGGNVNKSGINGITALMLAIKMGTLS